MSQSKITLTNHLHYNIERAEVIKTSTYILRI